MPDTNVLFVGGVIPRPVDGADVDLTRYGTPDHAADAFQWNMINGIERNLGRRLRVISVPFVSTARRVSDPLRVPGFAWQHGKAGHDVSVPFLNVFGVRNLSREQSLRRSLGRDLDDVPGDAGRLLVFVYAMHGPFLQQLALIKRRRPDAHVCLVVPDLPEHMRDLARTGAAVRLLKQIDMRRNRATLGEVDSYVLISRHQAEALGIGDDRYVLVEGMVDPAAVVASGAQEPAGESAAESFTVVYTGRLDERYGVRDLVDALQHIDRADVRLVLCGDGDVVPYIRSAVRNERRLVFAGQVSRGESLDWQRRADLLVNPRPGTADFTRYSFPSKNLEYLLAGKPVLAYHNDGTPPEYDDHLIYIREPGAVGIAQAIESILTMPEAARRAIGERGRRFVESEKSVERQMRRVLDLVGETR